MERSVYMDGAILKDEPSTSACLAIPSAVKDAKKKKKVELSSQQLKQHVEDTNLIESEIQRLNKIFHDLSNGEPELSVEDILKCEEMRANPFASRICELFSEDGSGRLRFDNFLKILDTFHDDTPLEIKMVWAFAMWDFDGDGLIGRGDIKHGIDLVTHSGPIVQPSVRMMQRVGSSAGMESEELDEIVTIVCEEVDPDSNGLSYFDFRNVLSRMPDFLTNFHIAF